MKNSSFVTKIIVCLFLLGILYSCTPEKDPIDDRPIDVTANTNPL